MKIPSHHPWKVKPKEAIRIQWELTQKLSTRFDLASVRAIAGVDVSVKGDSAKAAIAVLSYPELGLLEAQVAQTLAEFPYIPGLLAFREAPAILKAVEKLAVEPDLFIFDGQGLAHPRRMGIASHVGVVLDRSSIGCAKTRLCGNYQEPGDYRGSFEYLYHNGEVVGAVVRARDGVKPIFVSIGHRIDLATAIDFTLKCCRGYRLPEPIRWAHRIAGQQEQQQLPQQRSLFNGFWDQDA